jgi:hypothetical protein
MKKGLTALSCILFLTTILAFLFFTMMPQWTSDARVPLSEFSTARAMAQVKNIAQQPHYVGSENHDKVASYLLSELQKLGLQAEFQEGYTLTDWGNLVKSKNIVAKIKGSDSDKALLLLSHYDSAPHSASKGASDAGSGVATILESVRAYLYAKTPHKNDIIIVFSDAEELGLNGAALFVTQHQWAKSIGLALNFEARGSSGPSYMLMETNSGNKNMVEQFAAAGVPMVVSNSLMYSIYKMLPNDTDLTVFREKGKIQGFNFAFIDGHYNYHSAQDDVAHLDLNTLAHQGSYLMPLLTYFANANLNSNPTTADEVYFTVPFAFIHYPFNWVLPMFYGAVALFLLFVFIGKAKRILSFSAIFRGFIPLILSLLIAAGSTYYGWQALLLIYPQYNDLLNGFTYNGHAYIAAFVTLAIAICFLVYRRMGTKMDHLNEYVAPLFIWLVLNGAIAIKLPGAGFLILPIFFALIIFGFCILTQRSLVLMNLLLSIPALFLIAPFIQMFPIGLGLKVLFGSAILTVLCFTLLLPVFLFFKEKRKWALLFFIISIGFFVKAHLESGYEFGKAKSNSLIYLFDADTQKAHWVTYDQNLDQWTKNQLGENPKSARLYNTLPLFSKYDSKFTYAADAPIKKLARPTINFIKDSTVVDKRFVTLVIRPNRKVNRYDVFANESIDFYDFKSNGVSQLEQVGSKMNRNGKKILSYYVVENAPLYLSFWVHKGVLLDMYVLESSFDLLTNPLLNVAPRADWMMPTPFILNDAVVIKQKIKPSAAPVKTVVSEPSIRRKRSPVPQAVDTTSRQ